MLANLFFVFILKYFPHDRLGTTMHESTSFDMQDTHFFSRADEPKWPQQAAVLAGKFGIDLPGVFDVVLSSMPVCYCQ